MADRPDEAWHSDGDSVRKADENDVPEGPGPEVAQEPAVEDVLNRSSPRRYDTPRRYEQDTDETAVPARDAGFDTKI